MTFKILTLFSLTTIMATKVAFKPLAKHELYKELHRPQFHFTPPEGWMNDPNGLFYYNNVYHLFYQFNPYDIVWGNMQWGHATSPDLLHWTNLPVAIPPDGDVFIFSGSALADVENTSGLGTEADPPLIAAYTGMNEGRQIQDQRLAYSPSSDGVTWQQFERNPIIDRNLKDFRDPAVFWHAPSNQWKMVVALSAEWKLLIYGSDDLINWTELSELKYDPLADGVWECPTMFELPIEGTSEKKWVIQMSINMDPCLHRIVAFVGDFNGTTFRLSQDKYLWLDQGIDFFAVQHWNNDPKGRIVWIGWTTCWMYAQSTPTSPWRGSQSLPREGSLRRIGDDTYCLVQEPVEELLALRDREWIYSGISLSELEKRLQTDDVTGKALEIEGSITPSAGTEKIGIRVLASDNAHTDIIYNVLSNEITLDRSASGAVDFHQVYSENLVVTRSNVPLKEGQLKLRVLIDHSIIEIYLQDGEYVYTWQVFPPEGSDAVHVFFEGDDASADLSFYKINSTW